MASAVQKLRNEVIQGRKEGCHCPICGKYAREYKRQVNLTMVQTLWLVKDWYDNNDPSLTKWLHINDMLNELPSKSRPVKGGGSGDWGKLRYWGLIEQKPGVRNDGSAHNGHWRITQKGIDFLMDRIKIPKFVVVYNKKLIRVSDESVGVQDCLKKFSYRELMAMKS